MLMVMGFLSWIEPKNLNFLEMEQALCSFRTQELGWEIVWIVWLDPNIGRLFHFVGMLDNLESSQNVTNNNI